MALVTSYFSCVGGIFLLCYFSLWVGGTGGDKFPAAHWVGKTGGPSPQLPVYPFFVY
jgi:hypothetical protein